VLNTFHRVLHAEEQSSTKLKSDLKEDCVKMRSRFFIFFLTSAVMIFLPSSWVGGIGEADTGILESLDQPGGVIDILSAPEYLDAAETSAPLPRQHKEIPIESYVSIFDAVKYAPANSTLVLNSHIVVHSDLTISSLAVESGGILIPDNGVTVTVSSLTRSPSSHWISGSGKVLIGDQTSVMVDWFGTVADGRTDDSAAIQKAVNALNSSGGRLLQFGNRNYGMSSTVTFPPHLGFVTIKAEGATFTLNSDIVAFDLNPELNSSTDFWNNTRNVLTWIGGMCNGSKLQNPKTATFLKILSWHDVLVQRVQVQGCNKGIWYEGGDTVKIRDSWFTNNVYDLYHSHLDTSGFGLQVVIIDGCRFIGKSVYGTENHILVRGAWNSYTITSSIFASQGITKIDISDSPVGYSAQGFLFQGNYIEQSVLGDVGLYFHNVYGTTIQGVAILANRFQSGSVVGLKMDNVLGAKISANVFNQTAACGGTPISIGYESSNIIVDDSNVLSTAPIVVENQLSRVITPPAVYGRK
jgi:hypothetical protein